MTPLRLSITEHIQQIKDHFNCHCDSSLHQQGVSRRDLYGDSCVRHHPKCEQNGPELKEAGVNRGSVPREDSLRGGNDLQVTSSENEVVITLGACAFFSSHFRGSVQIYRKII